jgi:RNA polymerase sigma-70 factor (family 1)
MTSAENTFELQRRIALFNDEPAYKQLFFAFHNPLKRFAFSFLHNKESAEEVVSDVFIKMWAKRTSLTEIENLRVYLYISTKNTALNYLHKQQRQPFAGFTEAEMDFPSTALNPEEQMVTAEMMRQIQAAVNALPPRCRLVFKLVKEDGLHYREVADILSISIKTIDSQLAIALKKISVALHSKLQGFYARPQSR